MTNLIGHLAIAAAVFYGLLALSTGIVATKCTGDADAIEIEVNINGIQLHCND